MQEELINYHLSIVLTLENIYFYIPKDFVMHTFVCDVRDSENLESDV